MQYFIDDHVCVWCVLSCVCVCVYVGVHAFMLVSVCRCVHSRRAQYRGTLTRQPSTLGLVLPQ